MKTAVFIFAFIFQGEYSQLLYAGTNARNHLSIFLDTDILCSKHNSYLGPGLGLSYSYALNKYIAIEFGTFYSHDFTLFHNKNIAGDVNYLLNYIKYEPVSTDISGLEMNLKTDVLKEKGFIFSLAAGIAIRNSSDKMNDYIKVEMIDPVTGETIMAGYSTKLRRDNFFGVGLLSKIIFSQELNNNLAINMELGAMIFLNESAFYKQRIKISGPFTSFIRFGLTYLIRK